MDVVDHPSIRQSFYFADCDAFECIIPNLIALSAGIK